MVNLEGVQSSGRDQSEHGEEEGTCYNLGLVSAFGEKKKPSCSTRFYVMQVYGLCSTS